MRERYNKHMKANYIVQWIKVLGSKPEDLNESLGTYMVEKVLTLFFSFSSVHCETHTNIHTERLNKQINECFFF